MFFEHKHSGHVWLHLLSFLGAFLLGKEFERMRIKKAHLAHFHGGHHHWAHEDLGCFQFDDEDDEPAGSKASEAVNPS